MSANNSLIIDVEHLQKSFNGKIAVQDATLQLNTGDIFGFLGPNGGGKTTTIRMICGLLLPDAGHGTCLGYDIVKESYEIKQQVGYMTQRFSLYNDLTIYENLDFMARIYNVPNRKAAVEKSVEELGLQDRRNQLAGTLSGGWKQRLALSAALIHNPKLLLLDEPTVGVDPRARREFWYHIQTLSQQNVTILVSTHYMDEAIRCTKLAYIFRGNILTSGTAQEIIDNAHLYTYQISDDTNLDKLAGTLRNFPNIDQVGMFADKLQVTSKNKEALDAAHEKFGNIGNWQEIKPDLEEVFINLCKDDLAEV
jgi:ABC-2 type transport system ATP-binding protein